jgi:hypothetical protein
MKYLKNFNELFENNRPIYNKRDIMDFIILNAQLDDDEKDEFRKVLSHGTTEEFDKQAEDMGFEKIGNGFWVSNL